MRLLLLFFFVAFDLNMALATLPTPQNVGQRVGFQKPNKSGSKPTDGIIAGHSSHPPNHVHVIEEAELSKTQLQVLMAGRTKYWLAEPDKLKVLDGSVPEHLARDAIARGGKPAPPAGYITEAIPGSEHYEFLKLHNKHKNQTPKGSKGTARRR